MALACLIPLGLSVIMVGYLWSTYAAEIDLRLGGPRQSLPRIFGRAFQLRPGLVLSPDALEQRLNDVGYAARTVVAGPGEFSVGSSVVMVRTRAEQAPVIRIEFSGTSTPAISRLINQDSGRPIARVNLEPPMLTSLTTGEKRRFTSLESIPLVVRQAVLAIEDRRFYEHPGVDVIRALGAIVTNLRGDKDYLVGASTLTQQIVKNTFLTPEKTMRRKLREQFMAVVLESRLTKDQLLELYLNDVVLGQRGPFAIHGVAEAARVFFGKDIQNLSLAEAATIAGVIQSPSRLSPFRNPERALARRNVVLGAMVQAGYISPSDAEDSRQAPLGVESGALEDEAPYFVDYVRQYVDSQFDNVLTRSAARATPIDVFTSVDVHYQRLAQDAVAQGLAEVDAQLAARRRPNGSGAEPQAALVAVDPRTGDVLAMVGGRAYNQSQYNRAVLTRRQPGSVFKPFVYLAAFERWVSGDWPGPAPLTQLTPMLDEPTVFLDGDKPYSPGNYQNQYEGLVTLRRALASSRNIVAIKVAEHTGYDQVAALWQRVAVGTPARPYPSIALGVFEASPFDVATAFTLFLNGGAVRPLRAVTEIVDNGTPLTLPRLVDRQVARPDTTFLVTDMMRAVMNEGTGAGARRAGFTRDAAGKSGTTNDLRDAWFVGFTPELLTVVWVGFDDNQPIGLGGAQAALPIWTHFMRAALVGRGRSEFAVPPGVTMVDIDPETGLRATPDCPSRVSMAFLTGTEPLQTAACGILN